GGLLRSFAAGRSGRGAKLPPQLGHTPLRRLSTQSRQKVHSKVQIIASLADGGKSLSQHSQLGRSSSIHWFPSLQLDLVHFLGLGRASGQEKSKIRSGRNIARAHAHECGGEIGARG